MIIGPASFYRPLTHIKDRFAQQARRLVLQLSAKNRARTDQVRADLMPLDCFLRKIFAGRELCVATKRSDAGSASGL
jgi:hypothetical protein